VTHKNRGRGVTTFRRIDCTLPREFRNVSAIYQITGNVDLPSVSRFLVPRFSVPAKRFRCLAVSNEDDHSA
jgi:hypothetical protein